MKKVIVVVGMLLLILTSFGKVREEDMVISGGSDNKYYTFYTDGSLKTEITYKNRKQEAFCKNYYENGKLSMEIIYENGIKKEEKFYDKEGNTLTPLDWELLLAEDTE